MMYDHLFAILVKLSSELGNSNVILNFCAACYVESGKLVSKAICLSLSRHSTCTYLCIARLGPVCLNLILSKTSWTCSSRITELNYIAGRDVCCDEVIVTLGYSRPCCISYGGQGATLRVRTQPVWQNNRGSRLW